MFAQEILYIIHIIYYMLYILVACFRLSVTAQIILAQICIALCSSTRQNLGFYLKLGYKISFPVYNSNHPAS
jgi:hypothetical protein